MLGLVFLSIFLLFIVLIIADEVAEIRGQKEKEA